MTEGRGVEPHVRVDARQLEAALLALRLRIMEAPLQLEAPGVKEARAQRRKLLTQVDDYLLPRIRQSAAPVLVALVGSTGAGKSTLVNSIVGAQVSQTGIRRPTTNSPVLACHPDDMDWFAENVFLPTLPRVRQQGLAMPGRDGLLVLAGNEGMPKGVAVLDTPDIDSVVAAHHEFAHQFLDASDLWLFVTTASRYADAPVWELLRYAKERDAALGIVLSRVPAGARTELVRHFGAMLEANGLGKADRFVIPETIVHNDMLPPAFYTPVKEWLQDAALREDRRVAILTQTMSGVLDTFRTRVPELAAHLATQLALRAQLRQAIDTCYTAALAEVDEATRNGSLLRGETLARWQDFAGTGDLLRTLQSRRRARPASHAGKRRISARTQALKDALRSSLESLVVSIGDRAAEEAVARWRDQPAGAALLDQMPRQPLVRAADRMASHEPQTRAPAGAARPAHQPTIQPQSPAQTPAGRSPFEDDNSPYADAAVATAAARVTRSDPYGTKKLGGDQAVSGPEWTAASPRLAAGGDDEPVLIPGVMALSRSAPDLARRAAQAISSWQDHLMHLVQAENVTKRSIARMVSFDDESLALVLTVGLLGSGTRDSAAEGTGAAAHRLLSSLFGPGPLRDISTKAREDLRERIRLLFEEEMLRFAELIDAEGVPDEAAAVQLYQATYSLEVVR
jgi:energy-coupling factor transporter ATP-binding protein EcfA2